MILFEIPACVSLYLLFSTLNTALRAGNWCSHRRHFANGSLQSTGARNLSYKSSRDELSRGGIESSRDDARRLIMST